MGIYCSVLVAVAVEIMYTFFTKTGFPKKSLDMALFLFNFYNKVSNSLEV